MEELTTKELEDERMINEAFQRLLNTYLASNHRKKVEVITKAFNFAKQAHKGVRRLSGEPYIMHPIAVAQVACGEIGLGSTSICAALLHDVEEDTDYTYEDIKNIFGIKVANIVEGLTKIAGGIFGDRASLQAETFKKLLLTMSDDIRVILIKISDRLHNMRTLSSMLPNKQYKIAGETLYIYAPLADRLGLNKIKIELEDLSFKYEHPEEYKMIEDKLAASKADRDNTFGEFTPPICAELNKMGFNYQIRERVKSPYSIWSKMQHKHVPFEEVYDLLAIRIVFTPQKREEEIKECFNIYVALTQLYKPHPDRLRDWLSHPKANGYQALHVTLMSAHGEWIEVQIRSDRMDEIAEQGFAAHWKYKDGKSTDREGELDKWLHTIKEILDDPQPDTLDFLDTIKLILFASEILVFTPKGEIKTMPSNATALDFAFSIHSFLGSHCIGAKVNHKLVPINHRLKSGDQVEILTSRSQHVQRDWINYATTAKAKCKIQAILRREDREKQHKGELLLQEFLAKKDQENNSVNIEKLSKLHGVSNRDELLLAIGDGSIALDEADINYLKGKAHTSSWRRFIPFVNAKPVFENAVDSPQDFNVIDRKKTLVLSEENLAMCQIAPCCHPIPGDDVLGYLDKNDQLILHKRNCDLATKLKSNYGNRLIAATWNTHKTLFFLTTIYLKGIDAQGMICSISELIYKQLNFDIKKLVIESNDGIFEATITVNVHDTEDVKKICDSLKEIENITKAVRID
ncbi:MAG: RelA/SpoT family protein [Bacteroidaceae bacterium]